MINVKVINEEVYAHSYFTFGLIFRTNNRLQIRSRFILSFLSNIEIIFKKFLKNLLLVLDEKLWNMKIKLRCWTSFISDFINLTTKNSHFY